MCYRDSDQLLEEILETTLSHTDKVTFWKRDDGMYVAQIYRKNFITTMSWFDMSGLIRNVSEYIAKK